MVAGAVVVAGGAAGVALATNGPEPAAVSAEQDRAWDACYDAAAAKQPVLVFAPESTATFERTEVGWRVVVRMTHRTKWSDNPYEATCLVAGGTVKSVEIQPQAG